LRLIAGLERPDVGQVFFGDQDVTRLPIERRDVGMVFQNYALFPNLDVAGNIVYGLKIRGVSVRERNTRCDELLELVGQAHGQRSIHELSGGQRQRGPGPCLGAAPQGAVAGRAAGGPGCAIARAPAQ
jgi:putative spermidine/putrescine transport system ATP-binding protein